MVLGNYHIPKDKIFFIAPAANHFNPEYFPDPERFDPERFTAENEKKLPRFAYIPFGGGPRVCIGNSFAMMEAKLILATFVQQYKITLDPKQAIEPQPQITLSNKGGMSVNYEKRKQISA
jgi:cytochrome P450